MFLKTGIDLGGTKIEVVVLDQQLRPVYRKRVDTPANSYELIIEAVAELVQAAESETGAESTVGIGVPGAISPRSGLLRNSNTLCLNGKPLKTDLEARLQREIRIENDANCFVLSEATLGAARDYAVVFGVIIGTGTGGGLVVNGRLINGPHSISGEWGHNPLPWIRAEDGSPSCYCGKQGCIETFLSGPGLAANYQLHFGETLATRDIVAAAVAGQEKAVMMMSAYFDQMARALSHLINIIDPDAIVMGGGMSNIDSLYQTVPPLLQQHVFSDFVSTPIIRAQLGDSSGVFGAAMLWD